MILRIFKGTGPGVIFLIIVTLVAVWMSAFLSLDSESLSKSIEQPMPLFSMLMILIGSSHLIEVIISFLTVSLISFLLVNFNTTQFFINERTYYPAVIFILFGAIFPEYQSLHPVLPATVFLMLAIRRIMDGYREPGIAYNFFDAGVLISIGSLFYANLIWFGLLVIIGIALLRTGNLKEIGIAFIGLITPYLITFGLYYVLGHSLTDLMNIIDTNLFKNEVHYTFPRLTKVTLIFTGMVVLTGIMQLFMVMNSKKIKSRKTFWLLFWIFFIGISAFFILPSVSVEIVWITGIPVSYIMTHYFIFSRKKLIPEILFSVFFILIIMIQILYLF